MYRTLAKENEKKYKVCYVHGWKGCCTVKKKKERKEEGKKETKRTYMSFNLVFRNIYPNFVDHVFKKKTVP